MPYLPSFRVCCRWNQNSTYWQYFWWQKKMKDSSGSCIAPGYHHWESNLEVWFVIKEDWFLKYLCFIGPTTRVKFSSLFKASRSSSFWALSKSHSRQQSFLEFQWVLIGPSEIFLLVWKCGVRTAELLVLKVQMYVITELIRCNIYCTLFCLYTEVVYNWYYCFYNSDILNLAVVVIVDTQQG